MFLSRTYAARGEIPKGAEKLYTKRGTLFIMNNATHDFVADNPWELDLWNLTAQGKFLAMYGLDMATAFAAMAGTVLGGLKPTIRIVPLKVLIQRRDIGTTIINQGGSGGDSGTSGDGPPS